MTAWITRPWSPKGKSCSLCHDIKRSNSVLAHVYCRCDYIAQWEYPLNNNFMQLVVRSRQVDKWVGIGLKHSKVPLNIIILQQSLPICLLWWFHLFSPAELPR